MFVWLVIGCGGGNDGAEAPTYLGDIKPILDSRCAGCHQAGAIGPFPLTSYDEVEEVGEIVASVTESRLMPPWKAVPGDTVYANDPSLTDAQIATIGAWVEAGMPEGDVEGEALPSLAVALPRVDVTIDMPVDYLPSPSDPDDYRCFVVDWTEPGTSYVTGFEVHPGNDAIVHHVAAFLIRGDGIAGDGVLDTFYGWDDSDPAPGYSCFGGPSLTGEELQIPTQQVAQWVPGTGATVFPEGVGIPIPDGSLIVLQLHYNTAASDGIPDRTSIDLMTEPEVARIGAFAPWLDFAWPSGDMSIPANGEISHTAAGDPVGFFGLVLGDDIDLSNGFDIHAAMLHMHKLGQSAFVRLDRQDGTQQTLVSVEDWDFDWQLTYTFDEVVPFTPGDEMTLTCTWDNTTDGIVGWGEGTGDEMCVANLFVSAPNGTN